MHKKQYSSSSFLDFPVYLDPHIQRDLRPFRGLLGMSKITNYGWPRWAQGTRLVK